jgi:iron complex outermembrane receptor protein
VHGLTYTKSNANSSFESVLYHTLRSLNNPITSSIIEIERMNLGTRNSYQFRKDNFKLSFSADAAYQSDDRKNWVNRTGNKGNLTVDQVERVGSMGIAAIANYSIGQLTITSGVRNDWLYFEAIDSFGGQLDASGSRWMNALSPQIGLTYQYGYNTIYTGITTSFESPTTTELVNRPDLSRGFNPDLDPERSVGVEVGVRGQLLEYNIDYDMAVFNINVTDRLSSFQTEAGGDRTFFQNIGETVQQGLEIMISWSPEYLSDLSVAYTLSDFRFKDPQSSLDGNTLPGIPKHAFRLQLGKNLWGYNLQTVGLYHSKVYTNNSNSVTASEYLLIHGRISKSVEITKSARLIPYFAVNNILDTSYSSSVSINAFGNRFFEPGIPRNLTVGISLLID